MQFQPPQTPRPGVSGPGQQYQNYHQAPSYPPQPGTGYPQWQSPSQPLPPPQQWQQPSQPLPPQQQMRQLPSTPLPLSPVQQQMPVAPKSPKKRVPYGWIVASLFIGLLIGYAIHVPSSQSAPTTTTPQATTTQNTSQATSQPTQAPTKAPVTPTPAHVPQWTTVQTFTGNGAKKTGTFTAPNDWKIVWSCTPSSFYGGSYNLIVGVNSPDGSPLDPAAINTICKAGNTHNETEEHQGGQVYLDINSEGAWTLQVQELK